MWLSLNLLGCGGSFGFARRRFRRGICWCRCSGRRSWRLVGISVRAHSRIARAEDEDVAVQNAGRVDLAVRDDVCGPSEGFDGKQREGSGSGGELGVRCGGEKPCVVQSVEGLSVQCGDTDSEVGLFESGIRKDGQNAIGYRALCGRCMERWPCGGARRVMLGSEEIRLDEGQRQHWREQSPCTEHGGSLAGGRLPL